MEIRTMLVLLLGCCSSAVLTEGQSIPGDFEIASLPAYEEGYYLNRQFQEKPATDLLRSAGASEQNSERKVVDSRGREWVVAEPVAHQPGFYYNRHVQKDSQQKPKKNLNRVFLVKKNIETNDKKIIEVEPVTKKLPDAMPNIFKVFPGLADTRQAPVQAGLTIGDVKNVFVSTVTRTESPSSADGQTVTNTKDTVEPSATYDKVTNPITVIGHPPQVQPSSNQKTDEQVGGAFSCDGKEFGYYSDIESNCQQYHVCNPVSFGNGFVKYYKYSFTCGQNTRWDAVSKICAPLAMNLPCQ
ncbi:uncharacterized protein [Palaemon carinicauda]|uniref:uncharacterized protein n=1 Tax=Palaemon carinicauda TaxID=392227 RepID=UPI0035B5FA91